MCKVTAVLCLALALPMSMFAQDKAAAKKSSGNADVEAKLTQTEKSLWEAWKNKDAETFKKNMAADSISVGSGGTQGTDEEIKAITSSECQVAGFTVDQPKFKWLDKKSVLMAYHATQDATCSGKKLPEAVWATSIWRNDGGQWKAVFHQEAPVQAAEAEKKAE